MFFIAFKNEKKYLNLEKYLLCDKKKNNWIFCLHLLLNKISFYISYHCHFLLTLKKCGLYCCVKAISTNNHLQGATKKMHRGWLCLFPKLSTWNVTLRSSSCMIGQSRKTNIPVLHGADMLVIECHSVSARKDKRTNIQIHKKTTDGTFTSTVGRIKNLAE